MNSADNSTLSILIVAGIAAVMLVAGFLTSRSAHGRNVAPDSILDRRPPAQSQLEQPGGEPFALSALERGVVGIHHDGNEVTFRASGNQWDMSVVLSLSAGVAVFVVGTKTEGWLWLLPVVGAVCLIAWTALLARVRVRITLEGHGRATSDSHKDLPVVDAKLDELDRVDFKPYRDLLAQAFSEAVWGMVAHVVYKAVDPKLPASCSRKVIWDTIRQDIGFKGFLVSDDIGMEALAAHGKPHRRAEDVLRGGCDVALHCNGKFDEIEDIANRVQKMTKEAVTRYNRSVSWYKGVV